MEKSIEYASFNRRVIAGTIDIAIMAIILTPITQILDYLFFNGEGLVVMMAKFAQSHDGNVMNSEELWAFIESNHIITKYLIVQTLLFIVMTTFFLGFWFRYGRTPGKIITRCKMVHSETYEQLTRKQYVIRFFSYIISILVLCIGFIMVSFTKRRQGLHDMIAKTVVIRV